MKEQINHPNHYGGEDNPYEVVKVAEAWNIDKDAYLFNVLKYIGRSGKKDGNPPLQDLKKALWYLDRRIKTIENEDKYDLYNRLYKENVGDGGGLD
jgi:hypothetical protein|tara:strand:- start:333 stop:620 length:288 start_codon:yes stop_codon:yes gene_type:complete